MASYDTPEDIVDNILPQSECWLREIPTEILQEITALLPTDSFGAFRLSCRLLNTRVSDAFDKRFFSRKQFMVSEFSLQALVGISEHPRLSEALTTVIFGVDNFDDCVAVPSSLQNAANAPDTSAPGPSSLAFLTAVVRCTESSYEVEEYEDWQESVRQKKEMMRDEPWKTYRMEQQTMIKGQRAVALMIKAFANLKNLHMVTIQDFPFGKSYGAPTVIKTTGYGPSVDSSLVPPYLLPFRILHAVMLAAWKADRRLKALNLVMGCFNYCPSEAASNVTYTLFGTYGTKIEGEEHNFLWGKHVDRVLSALTCFRFPSRTLEQGPWTPPPRTQGLIVQNLIHRAEKLEVLELNFEDQASCERDMEWLCRPSNPGEYLAKPVAFLAPSRLPFLRKLALTSFMAQSHTLVELMRAYVGTLEVVVFRAATIAYPLDQEAPDQSPSGQGATDQDVGSQLPSDSDEGFDEDVAGHSDHSDRVETGHQDSGQDAYDHARDSLSSHSDGNEDEYDDENEVGNEAEAEEWVCAKSGTPNQWAALFSRLAQCPEYAQYSRLYRVVLQNVGQSARWKTPGQEQEHLLGPPREVSMISRVANHHEFEQTGFPAAIWLKDVSRAVAAAGLYNGGPTRQVCWYTQQEDDAHMDGLVGRAGPSRFVNSGNGLRFRES